MKKILLAALLGTASLTSYAQWVVTDPANTIQNTITAVKAVVAEAYQVKQRLRELDMLSHLDTSAYSNIAEEKARLTDLSGTLGKLTSQLEKNGDITRTYQAMYGASAAGTPEEFAALLKRRQDAGDAAVLSLSEQSKAVAKSIEASSRQHEEIAASLPNVAGVTEAAQLTASSVGVVIQQMQTANSSQAVMLQVQAAKDAKQNAEEIDAKKMRIDYVNNAEAIFQRNLRDAARQ